MAAPDLPPIRPIEYTDQSAEMLVARLRAYGEHRFDDWDVDETDGNDAYRLGCMASLRDDTEWTHRWWRSAARSGHPGAVARLTAAGIPVERRNP